MAETRLVESGSGKVWRALPIFLAALGVFIGPQGPVAAEVAFKNLEKVTLVLPPGLYEIERGLLATEYLTTTLAPTADGGVTVAGREDWQSRAYPLMLDCTGQQLIDASVVRVNGNRTEVDLSNY